MAGVAWGSKTVLVLAGRGEEGGGGGKISEGGEGGMARQEWREDSQETFATQD